jgi:hypothetical protein
MRSTLRPRFALCAVVAFQLVALCAPPKPNAREQALAAALTASEFRAHVSFLAADVLEGRNTPSVGLDVAAEYIASEFRRAELEPLGDDGYFQTATYQGAKVRNVAAILRGSDPKLKDSFIILSAHYDHIGVTPGDAPGDHINNGANDDASGTATVLALAEAFARLEPRPKRSLVFLAFYGEEKGLVGSRYYAAHPLVPLAATVADFNFEHMGRTDDNAGPRVKTLTVTGFGFTDLAEWLQSAAAATGVTIEDRGPGSDRYFGASDNLPFARAGVPANSICTALMFPDYHAVGDEWPKIDYANMAAVSRTLALAIDRLANSSRRIEWNAENPKTARFIEAAEALRKQR